ncbi:hypothetical protein KK083_17560 [Fulvivirgaceae bacterium PWU4]|uniref:Uncharacterized protein n=1 Tax=Chryseosolibacter histidini TaxID=2782349 RepID=A0AAP2DNH9_9BACT|nr:hypothetical protein [Chryseosolibacter histidini]MBT1698704.1 hypothetical protein [Chryseosolibacter histidini]
MVGLILLYFVGKPFYELAEKKRKSKWLFAILGIVCYYVGLIIGQVILLALYELLLDGSVDDVNDLALGLLSTPFGVLICWGLYTFLKNRWSNKETFSASEEILDADLVNQQRSETP